MKINDKWKWLAQDLYGEWYLYTEKPSPKYSNSNNEWDDEWDGFEGRSVNVTRLMNEDLFDSPWRKELSWDQQLYKIVDGEPELFIDLKVDDKILVCDDPGDYWKNRHFAQFKEGRVWCFNNGQTSWSGGEDNITSWKYYKLPDKS